MSNKPRKKKKRTPQSSRISQPVSPFDSYEEFEKTIDDIIELLDAQFELDRLISHEQEIEIIKYYLVSNFGESPRTNRKMTDVLLSLEAVAQRDNADRM